MEFLDDLKVTMKDDSYFPEFPPCTDDCLLDQAGISSITNDEVISGIGGTMVLITGLFLLAIGLIAIAVFLSRTCTCSAKCKERGQNIKSKVLFSMPIRYSMFNCLKFNSTALLAFYGFAELTWPQRITALFIFTIINVVPLVLTWALWKNYDSLDTEKTKKRYGGLYDKRNLEEKKKCSVSM